MAKQTATAFDLQCILEESIEAHARRNGCAFHPATVQMVQMSLAYRVTKVCIWWLGKVLEKYEKCSGEKTGTIAA